MRGMRSTVGGPQRVVKITDAIADSVSGVDSVPRVAAAVASTGSGKMASAVLPATRSIGERVGVMSRKTLTGILEAGEAAMRVLRGAT